MNTNPFFRNVTIEKFLAFITALFLNGRKGEYYERKIESIEIFMEVMRNTFYEDEVPIYARLLILKIPDSNALGYTYITCNGAQITWLPDGRIYTCNMEKNYRLRFDMCMAWAGRYQLNIEDLYKNRKNKKQKLGNFIETNLKFLSQHGGNTKIKKPDWLDKAIINADEVDRENWEDEEWQTEPIASAFPESRHYDLVEQIISGSNYPG